MTPLQRHNDRWQDGCGAAECGIRGTRVCVPRANGPQGRIPCDVLFVGEAPGEGENTFGVVLVGPAGHLFDRMRDRALRGLGLTWAATNVVGCIPRNPAEGGKFTEPSYEQVQSCKPRLEELVTLCRPRMIVQMGKTAEQWTEQGYKHSPRFPAGVKYVKVYHPAYILRLNPAQLPLERQRWSVVVRTAAESLVTEV